jgi:tRNA-specific 2-thiouridylase
METKKGKIYVAMSGGVDSSVAAALLKKRGFDIVGVFFKPWSPDKDRSFCNWQQDRQDALMAAAKIGIEFKTWDFSKEYGREVTRYMVDAYAKGITPNPDVMCNKEIKFGLFLRKAMAEGADFIATGHYARVKKTGRGSKAVYKLLKAKDTNKDQTYFLYTLTQKQLKYCLFPVGEYTKPEVRKLAKKFGLPNHAKKDSQGVCFVGQLDMKQFLKNYIKPKTGEIKLENGKTIGKHDGIYYYTIGQRHGLNIGLGGGPYFVTGKNIKKNIIYVSTNPKDLGAGELTVKNITSVGEFDLPSRVQVKIRYRTDSTPAEVCKNGKIIVVKFDKPVRAVTSGQSAVFYRGQEVLGGGIIK